MRTDKRHGMSFSEAGRLGAEKTSEIQSRKKEARIALYCASPSYCKSCGAQLSYKQRNNRFCSRKCAGAFRTVAARTAHLERRSSVKKQQRMCTLCGEPLKSGQDRFCSAACSATFRKRSNATAFYEYAEKTGEFPRSTGVMAGEVNRRRVKAYLEGRFGHKCSICGNDMWCGKPIPLVVDHIDGDPLNCKVDNFRLVCGNCDMQLPTYKGRNKGHGRKWRKRYSNE